MSARYLNKKEYDTLIRAISNYEALMIQGIVEARENYPQPDTQMQLTTIGEERERLHTVRLWVNYKQTTLWKTLLNLLPKWIKVH